VTDDRPPEDAKPDDSGAGHDPDTNVTGQAPDDSPDSRAVPFGRFLRYFLWLGAFGFGGPIATVGYMQRDLVEKRHWLDRTEFLNGVALGQTMPGPLAAQVAMWVGFLQAGAWGALAVALPFILPSLAIVLIVAYLYVRFQGLAVIQSLFYGIAPAVMAIIALAAWKLARLTNRRDLRLWAISLVILTVTALTGTEIALLFLGAGFLMILLDARPTWLAGGNASALIATPAGFSLLTGTAAFGTMIGLGLFFLKAGAFIFGSGLAIVPFLREGVVNQRHWLTAREFLDAVAIGLITPGPVVITAAFIGYLVGGFVGALVSTVAIFTPIYVGVVIPGPWFLRHKDNPQIRAFVKGATAAAAGAIAGATIVLTRQAVVDLRTTLILAFALVFVWRLKGMEPLLVVLAGVAGILMKGL
jgi:chromate transporter